MSQPLYMNDDDENYMDMSDDEDEIDYKAEWEDKYFNNYIMDLSCTVYVSMSVLCNGYMKREGEELDKMNPTDQIAVIKFGHTEIDEGSVYERMHKQFYELDSIWTVPLMVIQCDNPGALESNIKAALKEYQVRIGCSAKCHYKIPTELFAVSQSVIDIVKNSAREYGYKKIYCTDHNLDDNSALDKIIPEEFDPLFAEVSDSLDENDIRTIHKRW